MRTKRNQKIIKKQSQHIHFAKACMERLGHYLDQDIIIKQIKNNELTLIDRQSNRVTRWKYVEDNKEYMIYYDSMRKQLITIMPYKEGMENNEIDTYYWWMIEDSV